MSKENKIVVCVVFLVLLVAFLYAWFKPSPELKVLKLEQEVEHLQYQRDSLTLQLNRRDSLIEVLQNQVGKTKTQIVYLTEIKNEKVDSVYNLPIDGAIEFFTNQVSQETNSAR